MCQCLYVNWTERIHRRIVPTIIFLIVGSVRSLSFPVCPLFLHSLAVQCAQVCTLVIGSHFLFTCFLFRFVLFCLAFLLMQSMHTENLVLKYMTFLVRSFVGLLAGGQPAFVSTSNHLGLHVLSIWELVHETHYSLKCCCFFFGCFSFTCVRVKCNISFVAGRNACVDCVSAS